jgi:peptide/nickel transport system substrate-binding protein
VTVWAPASFGIGAASGNYLVAVLDSLGYKARFRVAANTYKSGQVLYAGWYPDYAAPAGFFEATLSCAGYNPVNALNTNLAAFCDPAIDRVIERAKALQATAPDAASREWAKVDRDVTNEAPWVAFANGSVFEVKSARVGNYQCNPQLSTLLDQLWVK